jgi:hypothetical protein
LEVTVRPHVLAIAGAALMLGGLAPLAQTSDSLDCEKAPESGLPLPTTVPPERLADYEKQLLAFLQAGTYVKLGWCGDKGIRDTGPWITDTYYGTHKAARVYYSPGVVKWLTGKRTGTIPDGAMIIKEGFTPPAMRYADTDPPPVGDWTVMIKDATGSRDGWFWGELWTQPSLMPFDDHRYPFNYPATGFGIYCTNGELEDRDRVGDGQRRERFGTMIDRRPDGQRSLAGRTLKTYVRGTHRMIPSAEALARLKPLLPKMGITRLANVTVLDVIGIPVVMYTRLLDRSDPSSHHEPDSHS